MNMQKWSDLLFYLRNKSRLKSKHYFQLTLYLMGIIGNLEEIAKSNVTHLYP